MKPIYTLITGASSGLGKSFAIHCGAMGRNLILISLPGSSLRRMASELMERYGILVEVIEFDLADSGVFDREINRILTRFSIDFLINNVGMGGTQPIMTCSEEKLDRLIQLNIRCTAMLTRKLLPALMSHSRSYILNISSMAAFSPMAYKTAYPASKAFIASYSLGLREELSPYGVSVSVAYPGPIMTNADTSRRILLQGFKGRMGLFSTTDLAREILEKTLKGTPNIVCGFFNKMNQQLMHYLPTLWKIKMISLNVKHELTSKEKHEKSFSYRS